MKNKYCSKCKTHKPINEFGKSAGSKDGYYLWCLHCTRRLSRERRWKVQYKDTFVKYKFKCARCNSIKDLEVHHLNEKIEESIDDLILVCHKCHIKHYHGGVWFRKNNVCLRCKHEWVNRQDTNINVCPKCKSPYWNKDKKKR